MANEVEPKWIYCNHCKSYTRHILVGSQEYHFGSEDESGPDEWGEYRFWKCAGCDTCTMEDYFSADYMLTTSGDPIYGNAYHPKRGHSVRPGKHFEQLPSKLDSLYREVVSAYNEDLRFLCAAGLRALVEGVCADKQISGASLEKKIDNMTELLPESIVKNLHAFRFIGNVAVHQLEAPETDDLTLAIEVIEDILNFLYALDYKASLLEKLRAAKENRRAVPLSSPMKDGERAAPSKDASDPE